VKFGENGNHWRDTDTTGNKQEGMMVGHVRGATIRTIETNSKAVRQRGGGGRQEACVILVLVGLNVDRSRGRGRVKGMAAVANSLGSEEVRKGVGTLSHTKKERNRRREKRAHNRDKACNQHNNTTQHRDKQTKQTNKKTDHVLDMKGADIGRGGRGDGEWVPLVGRNGGHIKEGELASVMREGRSMESQAVRKKRESEISKKQIQLILMMECNSTTCIMNTE